MTLAGIEDVRAALRAEDFPMDKQALAYSVGEIVVRDHAGRSVPVRRVLDAMRDELATILDDRQRAIWEQRFEEIREKWQPGPFIPGELPASRPSD